jgi:hypothetical protein
MMKRIAVVLTTVAVAAFASTSVGVDAQASSPGPDRAISHAQLIRDPSGQLAGTFRSAPTPGQKAKDAPPAAPLPTAAGTAGAGCSWLATNKDGTGSYFCHAGAYQYPTDANGVPNADGAYMSTLVESPWVDTSGTHPDQHSLAEMAVEGKDANGNIDEIIEIGWRVDPSDFAGDETPRLFIFHWIDGVPQCYDAENGGCGFVPYGSSGITPGMALTSNTTVQLEIDYSGGDWWYGYNGTWFGYLPGSLWGGTFTKAELVQMFGEVASTKSIPCSNMGNGYLGSSAAGVGVNGVGYFNSTDAVNLTAYNPDDPTLYDSQVTTTNNSFRYGGKGGRGTASCPGT